MKTISLLLVLSAGLTPAQSKTTTTTPKPAATVWKQEPDGFRGFKFGASRLDLGFKSQDDCTSTERYRGAGTSCERIEDPIGSVVVTFTYYFRNDKLVEINGGFRAYDYETLRDIWIAAYGRPHQSQHNIEGTAIGATYRNDAMYWTGKRASVFITKYLSNINDGMFSLGLISEDAEMARLKREEKRKAIQSLK